MCATASPISSVGVAVNHLNPCVLVITTATGTGDNKINCRSEDYGLRRNQTFLEYIPKINLSLFDGEFYISRENFERLAMTMSYIIITFHISTLISKIRSDVKMSVEVNKIFDDCLLIFRILFFY